MLEGVEISEARGAFPETAAGLTCDSRAVKPGDVFVALRGAAFDGHDFLADVASRRGGAAVVEEFRDADLPQLRVADTLAALPRLAANFYRRPAESISLIGVTGSNGKTTTTYLLEQLYAAMGESIGVIGTIEYRYADFHQEALTTTPLPDEMQRVLREIADRGCRRAAMEVSSHGLCLHRVDGILYDAGVFTNLSQDHLDFHNTMDAYREAKKRLFTHHLKPGGTAVINADDEAGRIYLSELSSLNALTFAIERPADVRAEAIEIGLQDVRFDLLLQGERFTVITALQGRHNVYNILGAAAAAYACGAKPETIAAAIETFRSAPGRLEPVENGIGALIAVDYSHTPDALEKCLETLRALPHNRILCVFGCGGDRDRGKRPQMGSIAQRLSDVVFVTSDNPRTEDPQRILDDIVEGMREGSPDYRVIADRREAIRAAVSDLGEGDALLIAGKGHETYQILGREKIHFDDREVARECLIEFGKGGGPDGA